MAVMKAKAPKRVERAREWPKAPKRVVESPGYKAARLMLAKLIHEAGRRPVAERKIYRSDLPVKPFAEWDELDKPAIDGRLMMAAYLLDGRRRWTMKAIFR